MDALNNIMENESMMEKEMFVQEKSKILKIISELLQTKDQPESSKKTTNTPTFQMKTSSL